MKLGLKVMGENKWLTIIQNAAQGPRLNSENKQEEGPST